MSTRSRSRSARSRRSDSAPVRVVKPSLEPARAMSIGPMPMGQYAMHRLGSFVVPELARLDSLAVGIEELEQENRLLRARNERLESEAKQQPAAQGGYAGITMWMGDRQITKHFTETMIKHAEVDVMEAEAKICIVNLKEGV